MSLKSFLSRQMVNWVAKLNSIKFETDISRAGIIELPMWKTDYPLPFSGNMKKNMAAAQNLATVWRCIQIISNAVAPIPLQIFKKDKDGNESPAKHDITTVLEWVNPWMSGDDLWAETCAFYKLTGNAYWAFEKGFTEIWVLRPDRIEIIPDQQNFIKGYKYKNEKTQKSVIYPPEEIVHFKGLSLETVFYGDSPIQPGAKELSLESSAIDYNYRYFENDATPSGVLVAQHTIDQEELKRIQRIWESSYKGTKKAHRIAVLDKNLAYTKVADSLKDMNFEHLRRFNKEQILMLLGVPPAIAGDLTHADYANIRHQDKLFYSYTVIPLLRQFETVLNQILLPRFKGTEGMFLRFDLSGIEALQDTLNEKATTASILVNGRVPLMTINEAREQILNLPKIEDERADELQFPAVFDFGLPDDVNDDKSLEAPVRNRIAEFVEAKTNGKEHKEGQVVILHKFETGAKEVPGTAAMTEPIDFPLKTKEDERDMLWKKFDRRLIRQENLFAKDMRSFFSKQAKRVLSKFDELYPPEKSKKDVNNNTPNLILDMIQETEKLKKALMLRFKLVIEYAADKVSEDLEVDIDLDLNNPEVVAFLQKKEILVTGINETTREQIRTRVIQSIEEGWTTAELRDSIKELFTEISDGRAMTIARTETAGAYNYGTLQSWKESGVVAKKEWMTAKDERVRESHQAIDGQQMPIDLPFSNGVMFPGEPGGAPEEVINCRCVMQSISIKE